MDFKGEECQSWNRDKKHYYLAPLHLVANKNRRSGKKRGSGKNTQKQKKKKNPEAKNFHFCGVDSPKKAVLNLNYQHFLDSGKLHTTFFFKFLQKKCPHFVTL